MSSNKIKGIALILLAITAILYFYNKYKVAPKIKLNELVLSDEFNNPFDISTLKGKKIALCFYASWCPDCLKELKQINSIYNQKLNDIVILAVTDESFEKLISFKTKKQYPFTFLKLSKTFNELNIHSIPTTYLLNTNSEIVYEKVGYINWTDESTLNHLKSLMN
jgi:cytochrome c-type biogenesis protein